MATKVKKQAPTLSAALKAKLNEAKTVSDKIRILDKEGMSKADISRALGKRYQHVRNVLEQDRIAKAS